MMRPIAIAFALALFTTACGAPGAHIAGTFSFTSSPGVGSTLSGAAPIELFACPYFHREEGSVSNHTLVVIGAKCVLRGEPVPAARAMANSTIDRGQLCTVPLDGKETTLVIRDGRIESRGSSVEVNLGGTTQVDGIDRYVAVHFSGDKTADAEEGECEAYLHPAAATGS